jgi:hypothetical protein
MGEQMKVYIRKKDLELIKASPDYFVNVPVFKRQVAATSRPERIEFISSDEVGELIKQARKDTEYRMKYPEEFA